MSSVSSCRGSFGELSQIWPGLFCGCSNQHLLTTCITGLTTELSSSNPGSSSSSAWSSCVAVLAVGCWRNSVASASRSCPGSDDTVCGLKFGKVLQKPCRSFQYGNSSSFFSACSRGKHKICMTQGCTYQSGLLAPSSPQHPRISGLLPSSLWLY